MASYSMPVAGVICSVEMLRNVALAVLMAGLLLALHADTQAAAMTFVVDRTDDTPGANACTAAANDCSLRGAVDKANSNPGADTINLPAAGDFLLNVLNAEDDANVGGDLDILGSVTINGNGSTIRTQMTDRLIDVFPSGGTGTVTLNDLIVRDGVRNTGDGGGIRVRAGTFSANNLTVTENHADGNGGGIAFDARVNAMLTNFTADHNEGGANQDSACPGRRRLGFPAVR